MSASPFALSEEQRLLVGTIRDLARSRFRPRVPKCMDGTFPWENMRELADIGILGMAVPEDMRRDILPKVCTGEALLAVCMPEPHAGTDVANYRTQATTSGDRVTLSGVKTLISRADEAEWFVVFSRIDGKPGREGIGCVLVNRNTQDFHVTSRFHTMGGENLAEVQFDNREMPVARVILREDGMRKLLSAFNTQRCLNPSVFARAGGGRVRRVHRIRARTDRVRPRHWRLPGNAVQTGGHVPRHRDRPEPALSRLSQRQSVPGSLPGVASCIETYASLASNLGMLHARGVPGRSAELIARNIPNPASMCYDSDARQLVIPMNANNGLALLPLDAR